MGSALLKAALGSLLVYALPLVTPHLTLPFGTALVMGWMEGRPALWMAAEAMLGLFAQDIAFFAGWRYFREPSRAKLLTYIGVFAVLCAAINWAYLGVIPKYFLTDSSGWQEVGDWTEECYLEGYALPDVDTPPDLSLERAGRAVVMESATQKMAMLEAPGCGLEPLGARWSNADPAIHGVSASGTVLFSRPENRWFVARGEQADPAELAAPAGAQHPDPVLSTDGAWIAWVVRPPGVALTPVSGGEARSITLEAHAPGSFRLDFLDMESETLVVARNEKEFLTLDLEGREKAQPWRPDDVEAWVGTVRRLDGGWAAWDAYQEDEPYRLQWSLPPGAGLHTARRGYRIRGAALDPAGRRIAVSVSGRYNFDMADAVYVLRAGDGEVEWLRSHPRFTRSRVAFLGEDHFAFDDTDGVRVLRAP